MTPDLPTRVREAFDAEFDARRSLAARPRMDAALAAVIAVVQEDRTRETLDALREQTPPLNDGASYVAGYEAAIETVEWEFDREFAGTTHD